jgi:hypothetical protein
MKKDLKPRTAIGKKLYLIIKYLEKSEGQKSTLASIATHLKITHQTASRHLRFLMTKDYVWRLGKMSFGLKTEFPKDFDFTIFDEGRGKSGYGHTE